MKENTTLTSLEDMEVKDKTPKSEAANGSYSAMETVDSYQEEMVIDPEGIKQEVDSEGENRKRGVDSNSAMETGDSYQEEMVIDPEDIKQEVDSEGEDTVDGHAVLRGLQVINPKVELDSSNNTSSCSLANQKAISWESDASRRERLKNNLRQRFPESALCRMLSKDNMPLDSVEEKTNDDLTSLTWLQDSDLLKNINHTINEEQKENAEGQKTRTGNFVPKAHPCHVNSKPPYTYKSLIFMAIEASPGKKLPMKDIYQWILNNFPYYQNAPTNWKNSVRHNLTLTKGFKKVDEGAHSGNGSLWGIDPTHRPKLLGALGKTPRHPFQELQMSGSMLVDQQHLPSAFPAMPLSQQPVPNRPTVPQPRTQDELDTANFLLTLSSLRTQDELDAANFLLTLSSLRTQDELDTANFLLTLSSLRTQDELDVANFLLTLSSLRTQDELDVANFLLTLSSLRTQDELDVANFLLTLSSLRTQDELDVANFLLTLSSLL